MAFGRQQLKSELIEQAAGRVRERLDGERSARAERFLRRFYSHVPPADIIDETSDNLYGAALSLWRFARQRRPGEPKIRVYNPRPESDGWKSHHTIVEIVNDDMPFLVDSVVAAIQGLKAEVHLIIHPVIRVERDENGQLTELHHRLREPGDASDEGRLESVMQLQISEQLPEAQETVLRRLASVLADVRSAVDDWRTMRERCRSLVAEIRQDPPALPAEEIAEGTEFLEWLNDDNFTYLGYREYLFEGRGEEAVARVIADRGLGILRDAKTTVFAKVRSLGPMPEHARSFLRRPELLVISKADRRATVHRPVHLDAIGVKTLDERGEVIGQRLFVGLFTSAAYSARPSRIPLLRRKVALTLERSGLSHRGHGGKALTHILDSYPRDELFQITEEELFEIALGILHLQERQRIAFFPRVDAFERFVSCLVYVPRDRFDTALRLELQRILTSAYEGELSDYYIHLTDSHLARLHLIVKTTAGKIPEVDTAALEQKLIEAGRSWRDHLQEALVDTCGEERGVALMHRFGEAFPASYRHHFNAQAAVFDIAAVERARESGLAVNLYRPLEAEEQELRLKIYVAGARVPLSEVLPMLENMGLKVIDEVPYAVRPDDPGDAVWIRDFVMQTEGEEGAKPEDIRDTFHEALQEIWRGELENDGFNRLVLSAGLTARQVTILRALCKYLLQARIPFSQTYMEETLARNPAIARRLVELFLCRFDPDPVTAEPEVDDWETVSIATWTPFSARSEEELVAEIESLLELVEHLDEDRIIRRFRNLIRAALRTNFFQRDAEGRPKPYLSIKFDSRKITALPEPRPFREIFVYSPRLEAVHLRGGRVARGGIRWSDRREDFRSEVLNLMKAQMVKNTVIVPVGSKGGFFVKQPPAGNREELMREVVDCYQTMMRGILDLTDNLASGEIVPPTEVVRLDDDDPYLVVAADKGTATFSDIANGISAEYGFWLGDAFASGGSAGYDHKGMAITARGAWESVKRHFRELDKDIQHEDFTVAGVGDMSGDVFGNGMLLSPHIRLLGAFNHLHVFVDPDPDPESSLVERRRLFELPRSSWADYDRDLLSEGGGVFERSAKSIDLTPEIRAVFGIAEERLPPSELIRAMLTAEIELLWFGGIGTFVRAHDESDAMVGDHANDPLRVAAPCLRAKVVGEGANLGMTQRARIEYAQLGGRLNTDSIDNSAGVDCSDHEVNIKILLGEVEAAGDLTRKQRDELLRAMTDEVADLVLRDNYLQTQAITVTHRLGARLLDRTARFIRALEHAERLDRRIEFLPDDEAMAERMQKGQGFTRPEISVLLSYAKMELYDELRASELPDDPHMENELLLYFPEPLRERFRAKILRHRLKREIIATAVTNSIVNRVGVTFLHEVRERTGMAAAEIARAYVISREIFGLRELWQQIESYDNRMPAAVQASMLVDCGRLIERGTVWFLHREQKPLDIGGQIERYAAGVREVGNNFEDLISREDRKQVTECAAAYVEQGAPEEMAGLAARLSLLAPVCDIVRIAHGTGVAVAEVGAIYCAVGSRLGFDWLRRAAGHLPTDSAWDKKAVTTIVDDLDSNQGELTRRVIETAGNGEIDESAIDRWSESRRSLVSQSQHLLAELQSVANPKLSMLAVANRQLKSMST